MIRRHAPAAEKRVSGACPGAATSLPIRARLGLSCSYHTAILCSLLGVPTYLETANEYYRQKAGGLKMPSSLEEFLRAAG